MHNMENTVASNYGWHEMRAVTQFVKESKEENLVIAFFCEHAKHRSVGGADMLKEILKRAKITAKVDVWHMGRDMGLWYYLGCQRKAGVAGFTFGTLQGGSMLGGTVVAACYSGTQSTLYNLYYILWCVHVAVFFVSTL